jgi:hypothetical protein
VFITQINPKGNWKILFRSVQGSREIENQLKSSLKGCQSKVLVYFSEKLVKKLEKIDKYLYNGCAVSSKNETVR